MAHSNNWTYPLRPQAAVGLTKATITFFGGEVYRSDEWFAQQPGINTVKFVVGEASNPLNYLAAGGFVAGRLGAVSEGANIVADESMLGRIGGLGAEASGGMGYRVMSSEEYAGASVGKWADSRLVAGDATESGSKWLWTTEDAAKSWQTFVQQNGEEGLVTTVDTTKPLSSYPNFPHPPQGTAVHVPIPDLGPAKLP